MARGYSGFADVMTTRDGQDLNDLFAEFNAVADIQNRDQEQFLSLFTFNTTNAVESVLQTLGAASAFEKASEYGIPQSKRAEFSTLDLGADFAWYDNRWASTWRYLANATAAEVSSHANAVLQADKDLVFNTVMRTLFGNTDRTFTEGTAQITAKPFANGDGWVPPAYQGQTFDASHTHFRVSGAATIQSGDLDEIVDDFKSHGFSQENGSQIVIFVNAAEGNVINTFRVATGARSDFVPAAGSRFFATDGDLIGNQVPASYAGFVVKGSYDEALVIESARIPAGYVAAMVSGGSLVSTNPIMFRQHVASGYQGLIAIPGGNAQYPLIDSYWTRGFGTGVRQRLAGLVMQVKASGSYDVPALYA
ncbi:hypothetical protein KIN34_14295 [Cellulomonas sp. DKR-3]|uniref:Phage coat protein n=1 Tax=Cellulomonas fulva TaxID=2835530 RepID=A0ABS5U231_9CELL|nr:hypothetical protein [Cellulomonas fulva]MBT0995454.1 hypothetical protein [Cellulomonas fulva]